MFYLLLAWISCCPTLDLGRHDAHMTLQWRHLPMSPSSNITVRFAHDFVDITHYRKPTTIANVHALYDDRQSESTRCRRHWSICSNVIYCATALSTHQSRSCMPLLTLRTQFPTTQQLIAHYLQYFPKQFAVGIALLFHSLLIPFNDTLTYSIYYSISTDLAEANSKPHYG